MDTVGLLSQARFKVMNIEEVPVHFEWDLVARDNAAQYQSNDPLLWSRIVDVLEAIEAGGARARERPVDDSGWVATVRVPGRDDEYWVVWAPITGRDAAAILHVGPALGG